MSNVLTTTEQLRIATEFTFPGKTLDRSLLDAQVVMTADLNPSECAQAPLAFNAVLLLDGKRLRLAATDVDSVASVARCNYKIRYFLSTNQFLSFVAAETADIRIGTVEASINPDGQLALRDLASRMSGVAEPELLHTGMSRADVRWLLGDPTAYEARSVGPAAIEVWTYTDRTIRFTNGLVSSIRY